jgi:hypothetical protein
MGLHMPKASTFYAGKSQRTDFHVFFGFQHSSNKPGQFTINVIMSKRHGQPKGWNIWFPEEGKPFTEGSYRIGEFVARRKDKWWKLKEEEDYGFSFAMPMNLIEDKLTNLWCAKDYSDHDAVLAEAVENVTKDVKTVLKYLDVRAEF